MTKATKLNIASVAVKVVPVLTALGFCVPVFVQRTDTALSAAAIVAILFCGIAFKDSLKKYVANPSAFKIMLTIFAISLLTSSIADQMLIISGVGLLSSLAASPIDKLRDDELTKNSTEKALETLKELNNKV